MNSPSEHPSERVVHSPNEFGPRDLTDVIEHMQAHPEKYCIEAIQDATGCSVETDNLRVFIAEFKARVLGEPKN